jgi:hypothetical protein
MTRTSQRVNGGLWVNVKPVSHQYGCQMKRFIEGEDRGQGTLLPELLDDYVAENNPVRVVDVFVDELDLAKLGFERVQPAKTGRSAYHPAVLLKRCFNGLLQKTRQRAVSALKRPHSQFAVADFSVSICF